jgi:hypothetical protein
MTKNLTDPNFHIYRKFYEFRRGCTDPDYASWRHYGNHGITMYKPWLADKVGYHRFLEFVNDTLGPCPGSDYCLGRKDKNKDFTPGNMQWQTLHKKNNTRRNCVMFKYKGQCHSLKEWSDIQGIGYNKICLRVGALGWTIKQALELA